MKRFKILFLGTPQIAVPCLEKLIARPEFEVVGVVTQPDRPAGRHLKLQPSEVKQCAVKHALPVISPESLREAAALEWVRARGADSSVVVAFGQILSKDFLASFPLKAVNVHASLLPRWRGAAPIQRAIMAGDRESGVSLQVIVPKLDAGPLLGDRRVVIDDEITAESLYKKIEALAPQLLETDYLDFLKGAKKPVEQDESQVTIAAKVAKEEGLIQWNLPATEIRNRIRGLWMWPGSWTVRGGKTLKIWGTRLAKGSGPAGQVIDVSPSSFTVACGVDALEVLEVQPESRAKMKVEEYLRGYPIAKGEKLG